MFRVATLSALVAIALGAVGVTSSRAESEALPANLATMKQAYRRPPARPADNPALVELGRQLFFDPMISASGKTSCASCHSPKAAWAANEPRSKGNSGNLTLRKTQTLIGIGYARAPFDWDGRNATLEAQAGVLDRHRLDVDVRQLEAPVKVADIVARIRAEPIPIRQNSDAALPGAAINLDAIVIAISAFERTIEPGGRLSIAGSRATRRRFRTAAKRGFVLFNGKANCVACHERLALHRRQVPRHRHHDDRSRPRPGDHGKRADAIRVQDADAALGRAAPAVHAQRQNSKRSPKS